MPGRHTFSGSDGRRVSHHASCTGVRASSAMRLDYPLIPLPFQCIPHLHPAARHRTTLGSKVNQRVRLIFVELYSRNRYVHSHQAGPSGQILRDGFLHRVFVLDVLMTPGE